MVYDFDFEFRGDRVLIQGCRGERVNDPDVRVVADLDARGGHQLGVQGVELIWIGVCPEG